MTSFEKEYEETATVWMQDQDFYALTRGLTCLEKSIAKFEPSDARST